MKRALTSIRARLGALILCEEGLDLIEFGILAAMVALAAIASIKSLGPAVVSLLTPISGSIT